MPSKSSTESGKAIFISYRRDDSKANTGRIYDRLIQQFDQESIFKDVDSIPYGVDFPEHLEQQVTDCTVLLAIVGPCWVGDERLQNEDDFVRIEIEYGLDRNRNIRVIPVLVDDAAMPKPEQLPDSLKSFTRRNAIQVRPDPDFHKDMNKLIETLVDVVGEGLATPSREAATAVPSHKPYTARGRKFPDPKELAIFLGENWESGVRQFARGYIIRWVEEDLRDLGLASDLTDIAQIDNLDDNQKLSLALVLMNSDLPLLWMGEAVSNEWLAANPKQAVKILESSLPDWYAKLRRDQMLIEVRDDRQDWLESIRALGAPVDWAKVDELILLSEKERASRFDALWRKFESGEYGTAKDDKLQALLHSGELGSAEQVTLLCCDEGLFLSLQEKYRLDSIEHLKSFRVEMDWEMAEKLIASNSWEEINPLWKKILSFPLHPLLARSREIQAIYSVREAQYLDVVALVAANEAAKPGTPVWNYDAGNGVDSSPAIGIDGTIFVGGITNGMVYALNGKTGARIWEFATGGQVYSSPCIGADGTVYVGSDDKKVYALDGKTGTYRWEFETLGAVHSSPGIGGEGNDTVYIGSLDNRIYALNGETGAKKWEFATGGQVHSSPAIGADGTVYVGSDDKKIYALFCAWTHSHRGLAVTRKWEFQTGGAVRSSPAIGADGTVYIGSRDKKIYALNGETGTKIWEFTTGGEVESSPAIGIDGTIYIGSWDKKVYALNPNGTKKWEFLAGEAVYSSPAIGADGTVYVGSFDKKLHALWSNTGAKMWEFETQGAVLSSPAIGTDGIIYFGSYDNKIYALGSPSRGPANSSWPMRGRNPQHTGRAPAM